MIAIQILANDRTEAERIYHLLHRQGLIYDAFLDTGFAYLGPQGMVEGACLVEARTKALLFNRIKDTLLASGMPLPLMLHSIPITQIEERQGQQLISHTVS